MHAKIQTDDDSPDPRRTGSPSARQKLVIGGLALGAFATAGLRFHWVPEFATKLRLGWGGVWRPGVADKPAAAEVQELQRSSTGMLPPGTYSKESLPPASPAVQAILDRVAATADRLKTAAPPHSKDDGDAGKRLTVSDRGQRPIRPEDKGKRRISLT